MPWTPSFLASACNAFFGTQSPVDDDDDSIASDSSRKNALLMEQKEREAAAKAQETFAKNQKCEYFDKRKKKWIPNVRVIGVHLDDMDSKGRVKPYYTIKIEGNEKQTTKDRLRYVDFDPEFAWEKLQD